MKVITGSSNPDFAQSLSHHLGVDLVQIDISKFSNGEIRIKIEDDPQTLREEKIVLVQSFSQPVDQSIIEFLLITDALERLGVEKINFINPWMGYSFQDKVFRPGEPIAAKVIADLVSQAFINRVFLMDLHNPSIPGFFSIPSHHLSALPLFVEYCQSNLDLNQAAVVSPDFGGLKRARVFADQLDLELIEIEKTRNLKTGQITRVDLKGNVSGKLVLIFDDAILSGGTVVEVSKLLKSKGAKKIIFFATHGLLVGNALEKLEKSDVDEIVITNSVHQKQTSPKLKVLDAAPLFARELKK